MPSRPAQDFPRMIWGSVVVQRRRCGRPTCHCADGGQLHEATPLSYSQDGRSRSLMLAPTEAARVRAAVTRYRAAQAKLEAQANAGLATLIRRATSGAVQ